MAPKVFKVYKMCGDKKELIADIGKALGNLPMYKRVSDVIVRDEPFPKTTTKKIKR